MIKERDEAIRLYHLNIISIHSFTFDKSKHHVIYRIHYQKKKTTTLQESLFYIGLAKVTFVKYAIASCLKVS